jgi:hypothetical protein
MPCCMFNPRVAGLLLSYFRLRLSDSDVNPLIVACIVPILQPFFPIDPLFQSTSPLCSRLEYSIVVPNTRVSAHLESPATLDTPPGSRTHTLLARHILPYHQPPEALDAPRNHGISSLSLNPTGSSRIVQNRSKHALLTLDYFNSSST